MTFALFEGQDALNTRNSPDFLDFHLNHISVNTNQNLVQQKRRNLMILGNSNYAS